LRLSNAGLRRVLPELKKIEPIWGPPARHLSRATRCTDAWHALSRRKRPKLPAHKAASGMHDSFREPERLERAKDVVPMLVVTLNRWCGSDRLMRDLNGEVGRTHLSDGKPRRFGHNGTPTFLVNGKEAKDIVEADGPARDDQPGVNGLSNLSSLPLGGVKRGYHSGNPLHFSHRDARRSNALKRFAPESQTNSPGSISSRRSFR